MLVRWCSVAPLSNKVLVRIHQSPRCLVLRLLACVFSGYPIGVDVSLSLYVRPVKLSPEFRQTLKHDSSDLVFVLWFPFWYA